MHGAQGDWEDGPSDGAAWEAAPAPSKPATNTAAEPRATPAQRTPTAQSARAAQPEAAASRNQPAKGNAAAKPEAAAAAAQQPAKSAAASIPNKSTARRLFTAEAELVIALTLALNKQWQSG